MECEWASCYCTKEVIVRDIPLGEPVNHLDYLQTVRRQTQTPQISEPQKESRSRQRCTCKGKKKKLNSTVNNIFLYVLYLLHLEMKKKSLVTSSLFFFNNCLSEVVVSELGASVVCCLFVGRWGRDSAPSPTRHTVENSRFSSLMNFPTSSNVVYGDRGPRQ